MLKALVPTWPLFVGIGLLLIGNGLQGTLLGVRATAEGFPTWVTGIMMSGFYVGFLLGSFATPKLIIRVGHVRVFAALSAVVSAAVLLHAVFVDPVSWTVLRFISGLCFSGLFVVTESWLNAESTSETRGSFLSAYMVVCWAGMAGGQLLLNLSDPDGFALFTVVSVLISLSVVPLLLSSGPVPVTPTSARISLSRLFEASPLGVAGSIVSGVAVGSILSIGPVYASLEGLDVREVSVFMAGLILAALLAQFPVGLVSDRMDRRRVIVAISAAGAMLAFANVAFTGWAALVAITLMAGCVMPLYSVAMAHTNDHLETREMVAAAGGLMLANGIGAALGPFTTSLAMAAMGPDGLGVFLTAVLTTLTVFGLIRMRMRPSVPLTERGPSVLVARATPVASALAQEEVIEQTLGDELTEPDGMAAQPPLHDGKGNQGSLI